MTIANEWIHGQHDFRFALSAEQIGSVGCRLIPMILDPAIGEEVCVLFTEQPQFVASYAAVSPINLIAFTGVVATPHGPVAYIVWQVAALSPAECFIEQFLNPVSSRMCDLVDRAGTQAHLKFIVVNNQSSEVSVFVDFENCFALDELAEMMRGVHGIGDETRFPAAVKFVESNFDLIGAVNHPS